MGFLLGRKWPLLGPDGPLLGLYWAAIGLSDGPYMGFLLGNRWAASIGP